MINALLDEFAAHGDRGAVAPITRIDGLKRDMADLKNGDYHTGYIDRRAGSADEFIPAGLGFEPRSMISVITPSPEIKLRFVYRGRPVYCLLPPTYADWRSKEAEILQYINAYLSAFGFKTATAGGLPQKLLAVHCGLGRYGRNNICYSEEFGSYMRVLSYVSDMPCKDTPWLPIRGMDACNACRVCAAACPTKAIDPSHNIVNADICLTSMNEDDGEFPNWLDESAHNCLIGCMKCQSRCPQNSQNMNNTVEGVSFTEEETTEILENRAGEPYTDALADKLKAAGISEYARLLPRNLSALLESQ